MQSHSYLFAEKRYRSDDALRSLDFPGTFDNCDC